MFKAEYVPGGDAGKSVMVAVKTTKKDSTDKENAELLREMAVMSYMVHPNIVKLYGVVTVNVPAPWIILEYLPHGDLRKFLQVGRGEGREERGREERDGVCNRSDKGEKCLFSILFMHIFCTFTFLLMN